MTHLRGVVCDIQEKTIMVITPDYDLITVEKNGQTFEVGEEIVFYKQLVPKKPVYWNWNHVISYVSGIAAVLLLCLVGVIPGLHNSGDRGIAKQQKQLPRSVRFPNNPVVKTESPKPITHTQPETSKDKPEKKPDNSTLNQYTTRSKMDPSTKKILPTQNDIPPASDNNTDNPKPKSKKGVPKQSKPAPYRTPIKESPAPYRAPIKESPAPYRAPIKESPTPPPSQGEPQPAKREPIISTATIKEYLVSLLKEPTRVVTPIVPLDKKPISMLAKDPPVQQEKKIPNPDVVPCPLPDIEKVVKAEETKK